MSTTESYGARIFNFARELLHQHSALLITNMAFIGIPFVLFVGQSVVGWGNLAAAVVSPPGYRADDKAGLFSDCTEIGTACFRCFC